MNIENNLAKLEGIEAVEVDLDTGRVVLKGENTDLAVIKSTVESIGHKLET